MYQLVLDTSTKKMHIIILENNYYKRDSFTRITDRDHSRYIVDDINNLLIKNKLTLKNFDKIIVGRGPGSYTGLRVSGSVAKILSYTNNIDLYSISSLYLLTSGYNTDLVCGIIDARRGYCYSAIYTNDYKTILEDTYISYNILQNILNDKVSLNVEINENNQSILESKIYKMIRLEDKFTYEPNYLKKTEAESNR